MNRYEKITSGSGSHGVKYEISLLLYYLLKAYESKETFQLSNGKKDKLKLDDIVLESDTFRVYAQAKHIDNESKKITKNQLFGETGKFSLFVYLKVAYEEVFRQFLQEIQKHLEEVLVTIQKNKVRAEEEKTLLALSRTILAQTKETSEETFQNLILTLQKLNDARINSLLLSFQNTHFHLVTNIFPNDELDNFSTNCLSKGLTHFEEIQSYYNFDTNKSAIELSSLVKNSKIPSWVVKYFLKKFHLVTISDNTLKEYIDNLLKIMPTSLEIPDETTYNDLYELIEEWQSKRVGVYLTRKEVDDAFFAYIITKEFIQELKTYENSVEFDISPLMKISNENLITIIRSPRHFPTMTVLQKEFEKKDFKQTLFVNPVSNIDVQQLLVKAFLHQKYTHLICVLDDHNDDLELLLYDVIEKIEQNSKFLKYKKIILFCDEGVDLEYNHNVANVTDDNWFSNCNLNINRNPNTLGDMESYYISRELSHDNLKYSEKEFLKNVLENENDFVIISNSAGMGKTSVLFSLASAINRENSFWSIIIQLNRFTELLESHLESSTVPKLEEFLQALVKNSFQRQVCEIPNILILMVDGFDEISPDYKYTVGEFLKNTQQMKNVKTTIITTRELQKDHLERELNVKSYRLKPLSDEKVCALICKFGKQKLNSINEWYDSIPSNIREFFLIPLHVKMFAESPQLKTELPAINLKINLYKLYDDFVNEKKEIFIKEKCNSQGNIYVKKIQNEKFRNLLKTYMELALEMTFKKDLLEQLGINTSTIFKEELCANGILELSQSSLVFVHQTFKEFFVAKWIADIILNFNLDNRQILEHIMKNVFMKSFECKRFVDAFLENDWNLLSYETLETVSNIVESSKIFLDMTYVNYDYPHIIRLMIEKCEDSVLINKLFEDFINLGSDILLNDLILLLIKKGANVDLKNTNGRNILHIAAKKGSFELVKHLLEKNDCKIDEEDNNGLTPLVLAVIENNIEISEYLISMGADVNKLATKIPITFQKEGDSMEIRIIYRIYKNLNYLVSLAKVTCLHFAAFKGNLNLFKYILKKNVCDICDVSSHGWNVLHCAVLSGNLATIKYLISLNVKPDTKTNFGETVLHLAVQNRKIELVKYFIQLNVKIDAVTLSGKTALTMASNRFYYDLIQYLLETYLKLEIADSASVHDALFVLLRQKQSNDLFKLAFPTYKSKFSTQSISELLNEAVRCQNTELVNFISENASKTQMLVIFCLDKMRKH